MTRSTLDTGMCASHAPEVVATSVCRHCGLTAAECTEIAACCAECDHRPKDLDVEQLLKAPA
jgi:hypothetical protein